MTSKEKKKIIVTAGLPYANGEIHLGHLLEYLQADFWVRFQQMIGNECYYFCGDDTHGTPIMLKAKEEKKSPEELIANMHQNHLKDFNDFEINFTNYGSTNLPENKEICEKIYNELKTKNHLEVKKITQAYCLKDQMFLPDRFVKGICPKCQAENQYGDSCDVCSATYSPLEMPKKQCVLCGDNPEEKESEHVFFKLKNFHEFLNEWVPLHTPKEVYNKLKEWLKKDELKNWDISREAPYFGFQIPDMPGKYFYVWLDAPMGYIASTYQWCKKQGFLLEKFWGKKSETEIYHFIGKDIIYFHTLFWPAILKDSSFKTPDQIFVHGFLTINGTKMSKSQGTFITARKYLDNLNPTYLRYYFASKQLANTDDIDLNFDDLILKINSDLIGKITNLGSRSIQMLHKNFDGELNIISDKNKNFINEILSLKEEIYKHYYNRNFSKAINSIRIIADKANKFFDKNAPWKLIKEDPQQTHQVLTIVINLFRIIAILLKPIIPSYVKEVEQLFLEKEFNWLSLNQLIENKKIAPFKHLLKRIEKKDISFLK